MTEFEPTFSDGQGWWICGNASYTMAVIPAKAPEGKGFIYAVKLSSGLVKIGHSRKPKRRLYLFGNVITRYGSVSIQAIGLSHPVERYAEIEKRLHLHFAPCHVDLELYDCTLEAVAAAIADLKLIVPQLGPNRLGRKPRPWFHTDRKVWCVTLNGKRIRLANNEKEAKEVLRSMLLRPEAKDGPKSEAMVLGSA